MKQMKIESPVVVENGSNDVIGSFRRSTETIGKRVGWLRSSTSVLL